jgi:hypothetical protein
MARRPLAPRKKPPAMRNILVELPEPELLKLAQRALGTDESTSELAARILTEWLET